MVHWNSADMPSQQGRTALVTGTGGLGFEEALLLARAGCDVVIAGRNRAKGTDAVQKIIGAVPTATVRFEEVDLASLQSVAALGARMREQTDKLDILINNAAVMAPPRRELTSDGFELQLGTNHLGPFALTGHLLPLLRRGTNARVVTTSSVAARDGRIEFDDLQAERGYKPMKVYGQSKLAGVMFALELQRRSDAQRWGVASLAAHPGISRTDLLHNAPGRWSAAGLARTVLWFLFQPAAQGALPALYAATAPEAKAGRYYGPDKLGETRGHPAPAKVPPQAEDSAAAQRLWQVSEQLTGVVFQ